MGALGLGFELALTLETTLGSIYTRACISYWGIYIYVYIYIYIYCWCMYCMGRYNDDK